jgi:protein phosphatase
LQAKAKPEEEMEIAAEESLHDTTPNDGKQTPTGRAAEAAARAVSTTVQRNPDRDVTPDVRLFHRAVVVAGGTLGGLVRQLSIDQFENEGRRVSFGTPDGSHGKEVNKMLDRSMSLQGVHKKVLSALLKPRGWKPPTHRKFFLEAPEIGGLSVVLEFGLLETVGNGSHCYGI